MTQSTVRTSFLVRQFLLPYPAKPKSVVVDLKKILALTTLKKIKKIFSRVLK